MSWFSSKLESLEKGSRWPAYSAPKRYAGAALLLLEFSGLGAAALYFGANKSLPPAYIAAVTTLLATSCLYVLQLAFFPVGGLRRGLFIWLVAAIVIVPVMILSDLVG